MNQNLKNIYICFPGGRHKALTLSYDDGREEDRRLLEILNRHGIKGTFHLNSGLDKERIPKEEWARVYEGHEVACHTVLHPTMERCPLDQVALQILEDRRELEEAVGYPVRGLSYPNGSHTEDIRRLLPALGIAYGRIVGNRDDFAMPEDWYQWKATCHHNHRLLDHADHFLKLDKTQYLYLMYVWGHSYEFARDDNWSLMEEFGRRVGGREDIWYATNIEIVDYMRAARDLMFTLDGNRVYNPWARTIWISRDGVVQALPGGGMTEWK